MVKILLASRSEYRGSKEIKWSPVLLLWKYVVFRHVCCCVRHTQLWTIEYGGFVAIR